MREDEETNNILSGTEMANDLIMMTTLLVVVMKLTWKCTAEIGYLPTLNSLGNTF